MRTKEHVLTIGLALVLAGSAYGEFTPHGLRLRVSLAIKNQIVEFDSDGRMTVLYDSTDGISGPFGFNNLAYDRQQPPNFYVLNAGTGRILRFPPDGGPPTVFADSSDGILGSGSIAFAADGDLYFASSTGAWYLQRITPEGEGFLFEDYGNFICPSALTADDAGAVYVGLVGVGVAEVYRYVAGDPTSKTLLASGAPFGGSHVMTMFPDQTQIYIATTSQELYALDPSTGMVTLLAQVIGAPDAPAYGIAVVPPRPSMIPATSTWGLVLLTLSGLVLGTLMMRRQDACATT